MFTKTNIANEEDEAEEDSDSDEFYSDDSSDDFQSEEDATKSEVRISLFLVLMLQGIRRI